MQRKYNRSTRKILQKKTIEKTQKKNVALIAILSRRHYLCLPPPADMLIGISEAQCWVECEARVCSIRNQIEDVS